MMHLALIPPTDLLDYTQQTDYQLCLPQQMKDTDYADVYWGYCEDDDQFVILDNGVAEAEPYHWGELVNLALHMDVDELVVPDIMKDSRANIDECTKFITHFGDALFAHGTGLMFVAQGDSWTTVKSAIDFASDIPYLNTIGIPRHLPQTTGLRDIRYIASLYALEKSNKPVHLLGGSPAFPNEISEFDWPRNVRGTDTSSPFNFAFKGIHLNSGHSKISRPDDYFDLTKDDFPMHIVEDNVALLKEWCE